MSSRGTTLRPLKADDIALLLSWFQAPHVAPWWPEEFENTDSSALADKYQQRLAPQSNTRVYIIQVDQKAVGMIQSYRHSDYPQWEKTVAVEKAVGIDYLVGLEEHLGKGVATQAIKIIAKTAFTLYSDIDSVVSVPQKENIASCRVLEKAGFQLVRHAKLESNCASNSGISSIYQRLRSR